MSAQLSDDRKKTLFRELVETQDSGETVPESRRKIGEKFGLDLAAVIEVEREGVSNNWPPLDISFPSPEFLANKKETEPGGEGTPAI